MEPACKTPVVHTRDTGYLAAFYASTPNLQMLMAVTFKWLMLAETLKLNTSMFFSR